MNRNKIVLILIILACAGLLGFAVYMQTVLFMLPCPLCVMQRYAFTLVALSCLFALLFPKRHHAAMGTGIFFSLYGAGFAAYQLWVIAQPLGSCGVDPWTGPMNSFFISKLIPVLYTVDGLCETPYDPILGLSIPMWSLLWCLGFAAALSVLYIVQKKERVFFGKIRA
jgi:disulfide bond formation protein DsbB